MWKILIADHDRDFRELVRFTLRFAGYDVSGEASGEECCRVARQIRPDLVLVDLNLPDMNGYATCAALKLDRDTSSIPVILMSETRLEIEALGKREACGVGVFVKPNDPDRLTRMVDYFFKKGELLDQVVKKLNP